MHAQVKQDVTAAVVGSVDKRARSLVRVLVSLVFERVLADSPVANARGAAAASNGAAAPSSAAQASASPCGLPGGCPDN